MKKFFAVFLALCMCCTFLVLPASASPFGVIDDVSRFLSDTWNIVDDYENGEITKDEFITKFNSSMVRYCINYTSDVTCFKDFLKVYEFCGFDVPDKWKEWYYENKMGGAGGGGIRDDTLLNGHGAALYAYTSSGKLDFAYYGNKGRISNLVNGVSFDFYLSYDLRRVYYSNGSYTEKDDISSISGSYYYHNFKYVLYGDWEMANGESIPNGLVTDLPEKQIPTYDDDSISDDDIISFFEDLLNDLIMEYPDLSNVEGLLRAILSQLGNLDSDNDNDLLCSILTAIQALKSSDNPGASDISKCLEDIKNDLVYNDGENSVTLAEQLNSLVENQIKLSDITIDESLYNQRFELIQTKLLGKFSFISEMKNFIDYALSVYSSSTSPIIPISLFGYTDTIDFSIFDDKIDLLRFCIAAFFYLSFAFVTFRKIPSYINGGDNL